MRTKRETSGVYKVHPPLLRIAPNGPLCNIVVGVISPLLSNLYQAAVRLGLDGVGTRRRFRRAHRQLRGLLRDLLSGHGPTGCGHDARDDVEAEADGERNKTQCA